MFISINCRQKRKKVPHGLLQLLSTEYYDLRFQVAGNTLHIHEHMYEGAHV